VINTSLDSRYKVLTHNETTNAFRILCRDPYHDHEIHLWMIGSLLLQIAPVRQLALQAHLTAPMAVVPFCGSHVLPGICSACSAVHDIPNASMCHREQISFVFQDTWYILPCHQSDRPDGDRSRAQKGKRHKLRKHVVFDDLMHLKYPLAVEALAA
jgi:hypothetical protein